MGGASEKLTQEGLRGNRYRLAVRERVGFGVWEVSHDLKGVRGTGGFLHHRKRRGYACVSRLRFDQKPRRTVLRNKKINLCLRLVSYVVERIVAKTEIVPHVNGFEQMAGHKVLESRSLVCDLAPVSLIPFWRLPYRVLDVSEPWADCEALMKVLQSGNPGFHCCFRNANLTGERGRDNLIACSGKKKLGENSDSGNVGNLREVAQVLAEKLLSAEFAPTEGKSCITPNERLWESAMRPERVPVFFGNRARRMRLGCLEFRTDKFGDAKRMHVVEKVSPHKAVAASFVYVKPCAASDNEAHSVFVEVEEALDKRLPSDELVDFVERDDRFVIGGYAEAGCRGKSGGIACDEPPRCEIVPREVFVRNSLGERCLSALARAGEKHHLAIVSNMLFEHGFIDSSSLECVFHGAEYTKYGIARQYHSSVCARMVNTKLFKALEWYSVFRTAAGDSALFLLPPMEQGQRETGKQ